MAYPNGIVPTFEKVHPTPVYEAVLFAGLFGLLWLIRKKEGPGDGWLFALYLISAGVIRFALEFVRTTPKVLAGLTAAQLLSVAVVIIGLVWWFLLVRSARRRAVMAPALRASEET